MKGPVLAALAAAVLLAPMSADAATTKARKHHHHVVAQEQTVRGSNAAIMQEPVVRQHSSDPCAMENVSVTTFGNCSKLSGAGS